MRLRMRIIRSDCTWSRMSLRWLLNLSDCGEIRLVSENGEMMTSDKNPQLPVGPLIGVRSLTREGIDYVVFNTKPGSPRPKGLPVKNFCSSGNVFSQKFARATTSKEFCRIWHTEVIPALNQSQEVEVCHLNSSSSKAKQQSRKRSASNVEDDTSEKTADACSSSSKRKQSRKRSGSNLEDDLNIAASDSTDMEIQKAFVGIFLIPVKNLTSPSVNRLIRIPDDTFVSSLKAEMLRNRRNEVAPIIGLLQLSKGEVFSKENCDTYIYECIGGNHSRLAHQQLLQEYPDLISDRHFSHRSVSIYVNLTDEQAQHLAHRHNRATEFINVMTTQDKVHLCRMRLFTLNGLSSEEETPDKTQEWRASCAETLMTTKKQLDENMIFFLASMSSLQYKLYKNIVLLHAQTTSKEKPDCKGFLFKGLRGMSKENIDVMLEKLQSGKLNLKDLNNECQTMKKLLLIKDSFVMRVGAANWEEATQLYPKFTDESRLTDLFSVKFNPESLVFVEYCKRAMKYKGDATQKCEVRANVAFIHSQDKMHIMAFSANEIDNVSADDIIAIVDGFRGFSLSFINHESISSFSKTISKINTQVGCYMYAFVCIPQLGCVEKTIQQLESQFTVQVAYFKSPESSKGEFVPNAVTPFIIGASKEYTKLLKFEDQCTNLFAGGTWSNLYETLISALTDVNDFILINQLCTDLPIAVMNNRRNGIVFTKDALQVLKEVELQMALKDTESPC